MVSGCAAMPFSPIGEVARRGARSRRDRSMQRTSDAPALLLQAPPEPTRAHDEARGVELALSQSGEAVAQTPRASARPVSRRVICFGRPSQAARTAYTRSPLGSRPLGWLCATASG